MVVGAGVAGLIATSHLHAAGVEVVCLEARSRVGGRTWSTDGWIDMGATWFWDGETAMAETVASLGLERYPQATVGDAVFEAATGAPVRLDGNPIDVPAWRVAGGMQSVASELTRRLPAGTVRTGEPVHSVTFGTDGSVVVGTGGGEFTAGAVVLALPPSLAVVSIDFRPGLPPGVVQVASGTLTWMSDTVKAVACYPEPFWRDRGLAGAAFSHAGPFREFHDHSGPGPGQAAIFAFAPAAALAGATAPEVVAARFTAQLGRLWGPAASRPSAVRVVDWSREHLTASPPTIRPGSTDRYGHPELRAAHMDGRVMFASTETADAFAGHVEGAIRAGRRAAGQALERLRDEPAAARR